MSICFTIRHIETLFYCMKSPSLNSKIKFKISIFYLSKIGYATKRPKYLRLLPRHRERSEAVRGNHFCLHFKCCYKHFDKWAFRQQGGRGIKGAFPHVSCWIFELDLRAVCSRVKTKVLSNPGIILLCQLGILLGRVLFFNKIKKNLLVKRTSLNTYAFNTFYPCFFQHQTLVNIAWFEVTWSIPTYYNEIWFYLHYS